MYILQSIYNYRASESTVPFLSQMLMNVGKLWMFAVQMLHVSTQTEATFVNVNQDTLHQATLAKVGSYRFLQTKLQFSSKTLTDVDECSDGSHECDVNAECANTDGSYKCSCTVKYSGNGITCEGIYSTYSLSS